MGGKSGSGTGMNILDHFSESSETVLLKFSLMRIQIRNLLTLYPESGMEKFGSGMNIPDPQLVAGTVSIFTDRMVSTVSTGHRLEKCFWSMC
jgi:hypothetical protein